MAARPLIRWLAAGRFVVLTAVATAIVFSARPAAEADPGNSITSPDTAGYVGMWTSLVLDGAGNPVVSYAWSAGSGWSSKDLRVLHCGNANCTAGNSITSPVLSATYFDLENWLALDGAGNPVVAYISGLAVKLLHCNDPNCDGGDESITVPEGTGMGSYPSLALDGAGNPVVAYRTGYCKIGGGPCSLTVLHCNDPNCAGGDESISTVDTPYNVSYMPDTHLTSLALDGSGYPVVSYYDQANNVLKVLHCNDPNCVGGDESITSLDTGGYGTSLALDAADNPVVSYYGGGGLRILHCNDPNCVGGDESITSPFSPAYNAEYTSLALDAAGNPVVSFTSAFVNADPRVVHCNDPNCAGGDESITSPDTTDGYKNFTSLALDGAGNPVVSYQDGYNNYDLKVLHCGNASCAEGEPTPTATPTPSLDLSITSVQAVQVVQEPDNSIPLVKDKATMVRVFVDLTGTETMFGVTVELDCTQIAGPDPWRGCSGPQRLVRHLVKFNGKTYVLNPSQALQLIDRIRGKTAVQKQSEFDRAVFEWGIDAFNFGTGLWDEGQPFYPAADGTKSITATIDPANSVTESDEGNNIAPAAVDVEAIKSPPQRLLASSSPYYDVLFLDFRNDTSEDPNIAARECAYLRATYPFPGPGDSARPTGSLRCGYLHQPELDRCDGPWAWSEISAWLRGLWERSFLPFTGFYRVVGILPYGCLGRGSGLKPALIDSVVFIEDFAPLGTAAHEIGHSLGFCEEYDAGLGECGGDWDAGHYPNGSVAGQGWDLVGATWQLGQPGALPLAPKTSIYPSDPLSEWNWYSLMDDESRYRPWIRAVDFNSYSLLLQKLRPGSPDPPVLLVAGAIFKDGTGVLYPIYTGEGIPSTSKPGDYSVQALDASGNVLAVVTLPATFDLLDPSFEMDWAPFEVILPVLDGTQTVVLSGPSGLLHEIEVTPNLPVVTIDSVAPVPGTQEYDLQWQATDADGDQLTISIDYSHDGDTYQPLALPATDLPSPFRFDTIDLPGGSNVTVRVVATDGVNTSVAASEPFAVADKPPVASILSPASGSSLTDSVLLQGMGYDPEDLELQGSSLQWFSSLDGAIGEGATLSTDSLSLGNHTITLVVTDSQGNTASDSIDISFADNCPGVFNPDQTDTDSDGLGDLCDPDDDNDTVLDVSDNCPFVSNPGQENNDSQIGNGKGIAGDDRTAPNSDVLGDACDPDADNDGIPNGTDSNPGGDITYDDNNDGAMCPADAADDGPSWDSNCNGVMDGLEAICPLAVNPNGDDDGDGLKNTWEVCKWGTDPAVIDSDGDTVGDCVEAADVDGNGVANFTGDAIAYAKAALLAPSAFGQDGDFDIDGNNVINFTGDVIQEAKFAFSVVLCR
jgi:hypothetical protein